MKNEMIEKKLNMLAEPINEKVVEDYLFNTNSKLSPQQKKLFIAIAVKNQLDPFKREIHPVPFYNKSKNTWDLSVVTGYEVYIKRAERTGKLEGWKAWTEKEGDELVAKIKIWRKDWTQPFEHEVYLSEYIQTTKEGKPTRFWDFKPRTMLKKVVISQGFRLAFPDELGGMPFTSDELPDYMISGDQEAELKNVKEKAKAIPVKSKKRVKMSDESDDIEKIVGQEDAQEEPVIQAEPEKKEWEKYKTKNDKGKVIELERPDYARKLINKAEELGIPYQDLIDNTFGCGPRDMTIGQFATFANIVITKIREVENKS